MIYDDRIYGKVEINEPIILEIIKSPDFQRLKGIDQCGYFEPYFPGCSHSRFNHSLGVYILLNKYGAPLTEQVAGLLHDISHGTFSHCLDYVLDSTNAHNQALQDNIFADFIKKTSIPEILKSHRISLTYLLDDKNFPLKEREIPDLCADRIDYSLRSASYFNVINKQFISNFLSNLTVKNNSWVFKNFLWAKKYALLFKKLNTTYYAGLPTALMFKTVSDFLIYALKKNYVAKKDFYTTDKEVLDKINKHLKSDRQLSLYWDRMNKKVKAIDNPKNFEAKIGCKGRIVDPLFLDKGKVLRFSDRYQKWKKVVKEESIPKFYFLKFLD